jgi:hypothetical protein
MTDTDEIALVIRSALERLDACSQKFDDVLLGRSTPERASADVKDALYGIRHDLRWLEAQMKATA